VPVGFLRSCPRCLVASNNGKVIKILSITAARRPRHRRRRSADSPPIVAALGITDAERADARHALHVGLSLWPRADHPLYALDINWLFGPPPGAAPEVPLMDRAQARSWHAARQGLLGSGSVIYCQSQALAKFCQSSARPGNALSQRPHAGDDSRAPRWQSAQRAATLPASLSRIDLEIAVAVSTSPMQFPPTPGQTYVFTGTARTSMAVPVPGGRGDCHRAHRLHLLAWCATRIRHRSSRASAPFRESRCRTIRVARRSRCARIDGNDHREPASVLTVGGWSLSPHQPTIPAQGALPTKASGYAAGDGRSHGRGTIKTGGRNRQPAVQRRWRQAALAEISQPYGVAVAPTAASNNRLTPGNNRIRRIRAGRRHHTVAGADNGFGGDAAPGDVGAVARAGGVCVRRGRQPVHRRHLQQPRIPPRRDERHHQPRSGRQRQKPSPGVSGDGGPRRWRNCNSLIVICRGPRTAGL